MHSTIVKLKDGRTLVGPIWDWRPLEGWFSILDDDAGEQRVVKLKDVQSAVTQGARVSIHSPPEGEERDELARARRDGWKG